MKKSLIYISLIALLAIPFGIYWLSPSDEYAEISEDSIDSVSLHLPPPSEVFYGIVIDSLDVIQSKIRYGQTLGNLLAPHAIEYTTINTLVNAAKNIYDVRKLIAGKDYYLLVSKDSLRKAHYFLFEPNPYEYVVYSLQDSVYANKVSRPISLVEKTFAGVIESSVYQTMLDNGGSPELVNRMVDVFAWQVDFFRIQAGDKMKVIYEEEQIDGVPVGVGRIKAAYFDHFGKEFYAIHYNQGSGVDFFDEEGNSLRKAFLKAPLNYTRISSTFSGRRFHPVLKRFKSHLGTDYAAPTGTPIRSVGDGVVVEAGFTSGNGNYVKVKHNSTYTTQYLHMSKIANTIKRGVRVSQGQTIGFVGSTGLATGPHLCFRFWKNGEQVNALKVELPPSEPIFEKHRPTFNYVSKSFKARLDTLQYNHTGDKETHVASF
jgi:murein DD-endopeptidase MepM/ murein hydrolase activator NlpD